MFFLVAERGALPLPGRPGGPGGHRERLAGLHGGVETAGTAGSQRSFLEGQGHQDLPEEEQPAQSARGGRCKESSYFCILLFIMR